MKKLAIIALTALCAAVACNKFDDSAIWEKLNDHENRIVYLEEVCRKMNADIVNLQTIVTALESNDNIVSVSPLATGDGYTFTFSSGKSIVIYSGVNGQDGTDGKDGIDGKDGVTPVISVMKDTDGVYYWTVNGEWLLVNGNKVKASAEDGEDGTDGITPQFKIEDDYWYVSYDNGTSWKQLGKASGSQGDSYFSEVFVNDHFVVFVLKDGTEITIPKNSQCALDIELTSIVSNQATFNGTVYGNSPDLEVGIIYSFDDSNVKARTARKECVYDISLDGTFEITLQALQSHSTIYYRSYIYMNGIYSYSDVQSFETGNISLDNVAANCYVIYSAGSYKFPTVKGNGTKSVGEVSTAEILWESFGTSETPSIGDLIKTVSYSDGYITFETSDTFKEGNAVIAAKDEEGTVLWSWHIWLVEDPIEAHVGYDKSCVMMDRNLGSTSAIPGEVGALGLLYQWGRKDPFLGSSAIDVATKAASTTKWPKSVSSSQGGTIDYVVKNPMTFVSSSNNSNWLKSSDSNLWDKEKTIYDPCPAGWRVPDGSSDSAWAKSRLLSNAIADETNYGYNCYSDFGAYTIGWYPKYYALNSDGSLSTNFSTFCWTCTSGTYNVYYVYAASDYFSFNSQTSRAPGRIVRCQKEE